METLWLLLGVTALLVFLGLTETVRHRRSLARIPIRIHVNGTRGKSSVTRLIAAGLRAGGIRTCAKTTGTLARMILPDGSEYPIFRPAGANVIEQLRVMRTAAAWEARAVVVECMAVQPILQVVSERKFIRATHGVITNVRADHLDAMGPTADDVALALAGAMPTRGTVFTAERRRLDTLRAVADDLRSELIEIADDDLADVTDEELAGFAWVEHAENVALALRVCEHLGVDRRTALVGMWEARPDPGVTSLHTVAFFGRRLHFVNGFAANDPESTERVWRMALERFGDVQRRIALFNCRADRPDRSRRMGAACAGWPRADHYVLTGSGTYIFARAAQRGGIEPTRIIFAEDQHPEEIFETLLSLTDRASLVVGMANIGGPGLELVQFFRNRSGVETPS